MRITIEPTAEGLETSLPNHKVILEYPSDDIDALDALDLVKRALVAWGYRWEGIFDAE